MFNLDSSLGIGIQEKALVLATVHKGLNEYSLKNSLIIENWADLPPLELRSRIQDYIKSNGFNRENVTLGLSRNNVIIRQVSLPLDVEENLEGVVRLQVEKYEPSEDESSYYDFQILSRDEERKELVLQIVMVRQAVLDQYLQLFREMNLYPAAVRYSSLGWQSIFLAHKAGLSKKAANLLVYFQEQSIELVFLQGTDRVYSESIPVSQVGIDVNWLLNELKAFLMRIDSPAEEISRLYLAGNLPEGLFQECKERLGDCELFRTGLLLKGKGVGELDDRVAAAAGLAISGISRHEPARLNLIPEEKRLVQGRVSLVPTYIMAALLLVLFGSLMARPYFQKQSTVELLDIQISRLGNEVDEALSLREQVQQTESELEELRQLLSGRQKVLMVLKDLTERIPDNTFLQTLQIQGDQVTMQGYSDSASSLLPGLMQSPYLSNVTANWITQDQRMGGRDRFNFTATIRKPGDER
ncbi:MAG TPA: PilN domain-containing protein [Acidobacteriota bacterium]|nr:PilN domain-containing protein [Acidobacteriota bacterium]